jgi:putative transposase
VPLELPGSKEFCNLTPNAVYHTATGGGAMMVDKYPRTVEESPVSLCSTGDSYTVPTGFKEVVETAAGQCRPTVIEVQCVA